jgi:hypothetical protein
VSSESAAPDSLRRPFLLVALALLALVVLVELGSGLLLGGGSAGADLRRAGGDLGVTLSGAGASQPPGRAIGYLAFVDGALLFTVAVIAAGIVIPQRLVGRAQGIATLIVSILIVLGALVALIIALVELVVMVSLFLAAPFGTIAYLAIWGFFPRGEAAAILSLLLVLKLAFVGCLLAAQQRFLTMKLLVALIATSLLLGLLVGFLHGFVPRILVSITDDLGAIVIAIVAIVWALILLIGSIPAIVKALKSVTAVE